ncbi:homoserine O-succinyltransferase [Pseudoflavonifractor sp. DSM 107456]|uniref:Homoserine O-acetyltransferase n=1 Tax=Pseudoflavonifractor gallinarum TaxID=2779352 RepID=A0ABR9REA2_9FIRM|nr:homoserine O-succinyltransferase [Pseudoflavonifractor gallinarum]MBE5057024.1 homoserine O-succinyltransferase [Pseudoflavonifractor gallinarum]
MPIRIPDSLPARTTLEGENIFVMTEYRAMHQDIRPLNVLILNLMPTKIVTETQILRKLSNTPLQIQVELLQTSSYVSRHTDESHLSSFYTTFSQVKDRKFDGMIITGAPVENMEFDQVDYWPELCEIMEWSRTHVHSTLHICWGAQAGLYFHHGIQKRSLPKKLFGVYAHKVLKPSSPLFRGFDDVFFAPNSRYTEVWADDILSRPELELIATSEQAGVFAVKTQDSRRFYIMGHPEYDPDTLAKEYRRDVEKGLDIDVPANYFPDNDPSRPPIVRWRSAGQLLYTNWLNYYVYQTTPYDIREI